jgi:hypothetical protein
MTLGRKGIDMRIKDKAELARKYFHKATRTNGDTFYCRTDDAPDWTEELVKECHGNFWPDDYRFDFIVEALDALADSDDPDDVYLEEDTYTSDLLGWLASSVSRVSICDEAAGEYGVEAEADLLHRIALGQRYEKQEVLGLVRDFLESTDPDSE